MNTVSAFRQYNRKWLTYMDNKWYKENKLHFKYASPAIRLTSYLVNNGFVLSKQVQEALDFFFCLT